MSDEHDPLLSYIADKTAEVRDRLTADVSRLDALSDLRADIERVEDRTETTVRHPGDLFAGRSETESARLRSLFERIIEDD